LSNELIKQNKTKPAYLRPMQLKEQYDVVCLKAGANVIDGTTAQAYL